MVIEAVIKSIWVKKEESQRQLDIMKYSTYSNKRKEDKSQMSVYKSKKSTNKNDVYNQKKSTKLERSSVQSGRSKQEINRATWYIQFQQQHGKSGEYH